MSWDVYLNGKCIDTVWYTLDYTQAYIRKTLINQDGYNSRIIVIPHRPA